jgi:hypothetical protein
MQKNNVMKQLCTLVLSVLVSAHAFSQVTWGTPVTVTTAMGSNLHPRIALNRSGNPYILWGQTDTRAYFSRWNGTAFSTPIVPSGSLTVFAQSWAGPDIAAYGDTVYVSMKVTPETVNTNYSYLAHSYNGGMSFSTPVRVDNIDTSLSRFPIVTTTPTGNPLVAFMKFNASFGNARYVVARSADYGMTFSADALANGTTGNVCDCCPATILAPTSSSAIMLFRNNLSNIRDMWTGISTDGGMTFPNHMAVDNTNWNISSCPSSGPDGFVIGDSIYTIFMSGGTGTSLVYLSRSSISALASSTAAITGTFSGLSSQNYPRIANTGSAAAAVWLQNTTSGKSIVYSFTNNISSGFSGYSTVTGATGSGIMNADVAIAPGVVHVVWEDDNTGKVMYMKGTYSPTSVEEAAGKEKIALYPNPANEYFTVSMKDIHIAACFLTDNAGRNTELKPIVTNGQATFSLSGITNGSYYFSLRDVSGKTYYSKIVVSR